MNNEENKKYEFFNFVLADKQIGIKTSIKKLQYKEEYYINQYPLDNSDYLLFYIDLKLPNDKEEYYYEDINNKKITKIIGIDYRLLDYRGIKAIEILYNEGRIYGINVLPEGIKVDKELCERLNQSNLDDKFILIADYIEGKSRFDTRFHQGLMEIKNVEILIENEKLSNMPLIFFDDEGKIDQDEFEELPGLEFSEDDINLMGNSSSNNSRDLNFEQYVDDYDLDDSLDIVDEFRGKFF